MRPTVHHYLPRLDERALDACNYLGTLYNPALGLGCETSRSRHGLRLRNFPYWTRVSFQIRHPPAPTTPYSRSALRSKRIPRTLQSTLLVPSIRRRLVSILNMLIALLAVETTSQQTVHSRDDGPGENIRQGHVPLWPELPPIVTVKLSDADHSDVSNEILLVPVRTRLYLREYPLGDHSCNLPDGALLNPGDDATLQQEQAMGLASFQIPSRGEAFKESQFPAEPLPASLPHEYGRDEAPARDQL